MVLETAAATAARRPNEVQAPPGSAEEYYRFRAADNLRAPYRVSWQLLQGTRPDLPPDPVPETPLIVFINARSGGRAGPKLARQLCRAVGRAQVFDLSQHRPDQVLAKLWDNMSAQEAAGDSSIKQTRDRMRILVAGGDGTITWVLTAIKELKLRPAPPVAIIPLGTGNDLSRSFGWGFEFSPRWILGFNSTYCTLMRVAEARPEDLDCWRVSITLPRKELLRDAPHCLHVDTLLPLPGAPPSIVGSSAAGFGAPEPSYGRANAPPPSSSAAASAVAHAPSSAQAVVSASDSPSPTNSTTSMPGSMVAPSNYAVSTAPSNYAASIALSVPEHLPAGHGASAAPALTVGPAGAVRASGLFFNYFSIGLDAKAAFGFHHLREEKPWLTVGRLSNQFWYSWFSCASGWFCCTRPLSAKVSLAVQRPGSDRWDEVHIPSSVRALVLMNLQSYAGGANLWGEVNESSASRSADDSLKPSNREPSHSDGMLEVVGLTSGYQAGLVVGSKGQLLHGMRICQTSGVRLTLKGASARVGHNSHCYLQIDGEPWMQDIPSHAEGTPVTVEIVHGGVTRVLHNYGELTTPKQLPVQAPPQSPASAVMRGKAYHPAIPLHIVVAKPSSPHAPSHTETVAESDVAMAGSLRQSSAVSGSMRDGSTFDTTSQHGGHGGSNYGGSNTPAALPPSDRGTKSELRNTPPKSIVTPPVAGGV